MSLKSHHLKMEGIPAVRELVQEGDWMSTIGCISVGANSEGFLRLNWEAKILVYHSTSVLLSMGVHRASLLSDSSSSTAENQVCDILG